MALADAGSDAGPIWLKMVLGAIPLFAALLAGAFALATTVKQRTERLKNLVDIRKEYPDELNPDYALERLLLRELHGIERTTSPTYLWFRRILVGYGITVLVEYGIFGLQLVHIIPINTRVNLVMLWIVTALGVPTGISFLVYWLGVRQRLAGRYTKLERKIGERLGREDDHPKASVNEDEQEEAHDAAASSEPIEGNH